MVSGVYLVRSFQNIFLGPLSDEWKNVKETPLAMWLPAAVVALLAVVLGMAPGLLLSLMGYP
jgi:NADH:ubiquinone oxidoreductase subunit 5 (subunit L)/multisubunit Na+/H+ antiporter MnhA subunit